MPFHAIPFFMTITRGSYLERNDRKETGCKCPQTTIYCCDDVLHFIDKSPGVYKLEFLRYTRGCMYTIIVVQVQYYVMWQRVNHQ